MTPDAMVPVLLAQLQEGDVQCLRELNAVVNEHSAALQHSTFTVEAIGRVFAAAGAAPTSDDGMIVHSCTNALMRVVWECETIPNKFLTRGVAPVLRTCDAR